MSTETLAPEAVTTEVTFDFDDFTEETVVMIGEIPNALEVGTEFVQDAEAALSWKSCYSSTCTWAECCDGA